MSNLAGSIASANGLVPSGAGKSAGKLIDDFGAHICAGLALRAMVDPCRIEFIRINVHFLLFLSTQMAPVLKTLLSKDTDSFIKYHGF